MGPKIKWEQKKLWSQMYLKLEIFESMEWVCWSHSPTQCFPRTVTNRVGNGYLFRVELLGLHLRPNAPENQWPYYFHLIELNILTSIFIVELLIFFEIGTYNPGWPQTQNPPISASEVLGFQSWTIIPIFNTLVSITGSLSVLHPDLKDLRTNQLSPRIVPFMTEIHARSTSARGTKQEPTGNGSGHSKQVQYQPKKSWAKVLSRIGKPFQVPALRHVLMTRLGLSPLCLCKQEVSVVCGNLSFGLDFEICLK